MMTSNSDFLKVPVFSYDVSTWLLQLEAVWTGVTDLTDQQRYQAVVRALPSEVACRLSSVLANPPTEQRYEAVKSALLAAFGKSQADYFAALDSVHFHGGRPSALLARMLDLNRAAGTPLSEEMLRYRHANLMPHPVRLQLAAARHTLSTAEYSRLVDSVHDAHVAAAWTPPGHTCCTCGHDRPPQLPLAPPPSDASAAALALHSVRGHAPAGHEARPAAPPPHDATSTHACLAAMQASLQRLEAAITNSPAAPRPAYCFYHARFGAEARNCQPPCAWLRQGNGRRGGR